MAKKKSKDNTAIYVAIIGLAGTIIVALINLLSTRMQVEIPISATKTAQSNSTPFDSLSLKPTPSPAQSDSGDNIDGNSIEPSVECLQEYFDDVSIGLQTNLEVNISTNLDIPSSLTDSFSIGPVGAVLTRNAIPVGAVKLLIFPEAHSFKFTSIVDADCHIVDDFENLTRSSHDTLQNWDVLGINFNEETFFTLRVGWQGKRIQFILRQD